MRGSHKAPATGSSGTIPSSSAESIFWRAFDERFPELMPKTSKAGCESLAGGELVGMIG